MSIPDTPVGWRQVNFWCDDWQAAEQVTVNDLGPLFAAAEAGGVIRSWWFARKSESWRLRYLPTHGRHEQADSLVDEALPDLVEEGVVRRWISAAYEPEIHAFGGEDGIDLAHWLFHADSGHVLAYLRQAGTRHRRELGLILAATLMRAANLEWYEQGDVWAQVTAHRATERPSPSEAAAHSVFQLITARSDSTQSPLTTSPAWSAAFQRAGEGLAELAYEGRLARGLRAVLAHHVLFAWNRMGLPAYVQGVLAGTAAHTVFHREPSPVSAPIPASAAPAPASLNAVTTDTTTPDASAEELRADLAAHLRANGQIRTDPIEKAFLAVERHLFLPGVDLGTAYAPRPVVTKRAEDGTAISSASNPRIVADQLEDLDVQPGHRVLEIGAATGINAALLCEVASATGKVVTIEIDEDLAEGARSSLAAAGYGHVRVICGDGAAGHPDGAPYDRIIVTAEAWDLSLPWLEQLAPGGRIVLPWRLHGSGLTRSLALDLQLSGRMVSRHARMCGFVPMLGAGAHDEGRALQLCPDAVLQLDARDPHNEAALIQVLKHPPREHWTGIGVRILPKEEPIEHLDLWLATNTTHFCRLKVTKAARERGLADPAYRWAGAGIYDGGTIAYVAMRPLDANSEQLGVTAHGPDSDKLAATLLELLHQWDSNRPSQPYVTIHPADTPHEQLAPGTLISRPNTRLTIAW